MRRMQAGIPCHICILAENTNRVSWLACAFKTCYLYAWRIRRCRIMQAILIAMHVLMQFESGMYAKPMHSCKECPMHKATEVSVHRTTQMQLLTTGQQSRAHAIHGSSSSTSIVCRYVHRFSLRSCEVALRNPGAAGAACPAEDSTSTAWGLAAWGAGCSVPSSVPKAGT